MSLKKKQTIKCSNRVGYSFFVGSIVGLVFFMAQSNRTHAQDNELDQRRTNREQIHSQNSKNLGFYRVIIENNLFRPLGWRRPSREPKYILLATLVESRGETAKALLMEQKSNQIYYVSRGEKVGDAVIENIESKQVNLKISGKILTLKLPSIQFLNPSQFADESDRTLSQPSTRSANNLTSRRSPRNLINKTRTNRDGNRQSWPRQLRHEFRNATSIERRRLLEEY